MINILIPLAGSNQFFSDVEYPFPKPLIEINGLSMIEHVINNFSSITCKKRFIFIVNGSDCKKYHLHNTLNLLCENACKIIKVNNETKGAACSALMAIEYINNDYPLIISNADQIIDADFNQVLDNFESYDAGVITFESVHPRWSYIRKNTQGDIVETSEKNPISKDAIAGFYYFAQGKEFCDAAMSSIAKDASVNGLYFVAPVFNELVLQNKKLTSYALSNNFYHTFYTPNKIKEYESLSKC